MENKEYFGRVASIFRKVEDLLDEFEDEIDYACTPDKLELTVEATGRRVVLNTQQAVHELWLAGNARGWHFKYQPEQDRWFAEAEQEEFDECFTRLLENHLDQPVSFT